MSRAGERKWRNEMKIKIRENGPVILETQEAFSVHVEGSTEQKTGPIVLCRCGQSARKPFCDGTHRTAGFTAPAAELLIG
jgi:CDGSH-type Zn-finger protein